LMELADDIASLWVTANSAANALSSKTALTADWQVSKSPSTANTVRLSPGCVVICRCWIAETPARGYETAMRVWARSAKPLSAATPVSPDVATRTR